MLQTSPKRKIGKALKEKIMKKIAFAILGASTLSIAACANEADEAADVDETIVDESYDENAASLDEAMDDGVIEEVEQPVVEPAPAPSTEIGEEDVMAEDPETDDVVGL